MNNADAVMLNYFFSRNTFRKILKDGTCPVYASVVQRYVTNHAGKTHGECIREIYQYLSEEHQNEYFYKNTLLNQLLAEASDPRTAAALTELPVSGSKADFIFIDNNAVVYEIKTDLDNFDRLDGQISNYYKAFSRVTVVTSEGKLQELQEKLKGSPSGICVLDREGLISVRRESSENRQSLSKAAMFRILRKKEYEQILLNFFDALPVVSQFEYYRACQKLFESLPVDVAYNCFTRSLKSRVKTDIAWYAKVPYELKFLAYFSNYRKREYDELQHFLQTGGSLSITHG